MKKSVKFIMVFMFLIIVGLVAFIVYDKVINVEDESSNKKNNEVNNTDEIVNNTISENNTIDDKKATDNEYEVLTSELPEGSSLFVTNVIDNGDTYTLQGVIYEEYIVSEEELKEAVTSGMMTIEGESYVVKKEVDEDIEMYELYKDDFPHFSIRKHEDLEYHLIRLAQISNCQRKTDKKKQITVSKSVKCENSYLEGSEGEKIVEDEFKDYSPLTPPETSETVYPTPSYTFEFKNGKCTKVLVDTGI